MSKEPEVSVGIMSDEVIEFELNASFLLLENNQVYTGNQQVRYLDNCIQFDGACFDKLTFNPFIYPAASFCLKNVTIGIQFHWEQKENQTFKGSLLFIKENSAITAINKLLVEDYLTSVISSEMSSSASIELLKSHAVISRSWLLSNMKKKEEPTQKIPTSIQTELGDEIIKWYERDEHTNFDVCADDHCQRYQGITRINSANAIHAVKATCGEVLMYKNQICDTRFSKSCGGISEKFESCWDDVHHAYLDRVSDSTVEYKTDLTIEKNAAEWISGAPDAFCNTTDKRILSQVLNNYDQTTTDFFRWKVTYTQAELSELIKKRSGIDFGDIQELIPVERGVSGRLIKLKIVGTKRSIVVGKELEIRKWLSPSHLYSSAFIVSTDENSNFTLSGAGWGHGVGLCQIGAAVMGEKGYTYKQILLHYYRGGAELKKIY